MSNSAITELIDVFTISVLLRALWIVLWLVICSIVADCLACRCWFFYRKSRSILPKFMVSLESPLDSVLDVSLYFVRENALFYLVSMSLPKLLSSESNCSCLMTLVLLSSWMDLSTIIFLPLRLLQTISKNLLLLLFWALSTFTVFSCLSIYFSSRTLFALP